MCDSHTILVYWVLIAQWLEHWLGVPGGPGFELHLGLIVGTIVEGVADTCIISPLLELKYDFNLTNPPAKLNNHFMNEWMYEWINVWMNEWVNEPINQSVNAGNWKHEILKIN